MEKTITIAELKARETVKSWSVKSSSPRGIETKMTADVKPGDEVVLSNRFTLVTE